VIDGELGSFLRSKRESLAPADVGLPGGPRRRVPGLRRAEVATLAGVSVDYLTRLEQGRDRHPSAQVLAALAEALRLDDDELDHLRCLAVVSHGTELCPGPRPAARAVRPTVQALLDQLEPGLAYVANHLGDLLAWTAGFDRLARPVGLLDGAPPNLVRFTFLDSRARDVFPDWVDLADELAAQLYADAGHPGDDVRAMAAGLAEAAGPEFATRWARRPLGARRSGVRLLARPDLGALRLSFEVLELADPERQRLVVLLPADAATATALDRLAGRRPGALRAVERGA